MNPMQSPNTGVGGSAHGNRDTRKMAWEEDFKRNPPPAGIEVEILCNHAWGDFVITATRVDYKLGSNKKQLKTGWRFVKDGNRVSEPALAWRHL